MNNVMNEEHVLLVEEWEMKPSEGDVNISISKLQIYLVHKHMQEANTA